MYQKCSDIICDKTLLKVFQILYSNFISITYELLVLSNRNIYLKKLDGKTYVQPENTVTLKVKLEWSHIDSILSP